MSQVKIQGNASGTGIFTVAAPNSNTDRTLTLPDTTGTVVATDASGNVGIGTSTAASGFSALVLNGNSVGNHQNNAGIQLNYNSGTYGGAAITTVNAQGGGLSIYTYEGNIGSETYVERMRIAGNGQQSSVIPSGSTLYNEYKCRAWVNFNGTGTVAIRASGNVSSITDHGTGVYTLNFATSMPDVNYAVAACGTSSSNWQVGINDDSETPQVGQVKVKTQTGGGVANDTPYGLFAIFR